MAILIGQRIGNFEVVALIGRGGMGEVYRARDQQLQRDVALKLLPDVFASDPERLARFQREAQVLAALNHPNIAHIYGLEGAGTSRCIVMELVDGETLQERLKRGPIPVEEALSIAKQIAEALEAAHEKDIVHRDLKPGNVKITPEGRVKVLDFGLAKPLQEAANRDFSNSPTLSIAATNAGVILGTAAYMSPEQARGEDTDKRSDVFSFGCVLYEMLSGRQTFQGKTVSDILASVLAREPDFTLLPQGLNPRLYELLRRCVDKNARERWQAVGDLKIEIGKVASDPFAKPEPQSQAVQPKMQRLWAAAAGIFLIAFLAVAVVHFQQTPALEQAFSLSVALPENTTVMHLALSPDGRQLVMQLLNTPPSQLWLRSLDSPELQPLPGTDFGRTPFWSPDGRSIGFFADNKLKIVSATGGPPQALCDGTGPGRGGTWNSGGVILFGSDTGLQRVNASGGSCDPVSQAELGAFPDFLPDGNHFLYTVTRGDETQRGIHVASLDDPSGRRLLADVSSAMFSPASSSRNTGYILFLRNGTLLAQSFDSGSLQAVGDVFQVATDASFSSTGSQAAASASANGVLVYVTSPATTEQLTWFDRSGKEIEKLGAPGQIRSIAHSPSGRNVVISRAGQGLWLRELLRNIETPFTFPPLIGGAAVWSPDGNRIAFSSNGDLYAKNVASGEEESLLMKGNRRSPSGWSGDGRFLIYTEVDPKTDGDLWVLPNMQSKPEMPVKFLQTEFVESQAQFSPDGRWVAYTSDESGIYDVYVRPFPAGPGKWRVSNNGGMQPRWRPDGKELFYLEGAGRFTLMAVPVQPTPSGSFSTGRPEKLFNFDAPNLLPAGNPFEYSPADDGKRFLVNAIANTAAQTLNVLVNWEQPSVSAKK